MSLIRVVLILVAYYGSVTSAGCAVDPDSNGHVTIPSSWTQIATDAFKACGTLVSVTIHNSITSIGQQAFYNCDKLVSVVIPDSVTILGASAFRSCGALESVTISNSLLEISGSTFKYCGKLSSVIFSSSSTLATIGNSAFGLCNALVSITLPDSVVSVGESAFVGCNALRVLNFGPNVQTIGTEAFSRCTNLASLVIPDLVEYAPQGMCYQCTALKTLTISASMREVSPVAFYQTSSLSTVIIRSQNITFRDAAFMSSGMVGSSSGNQVLLMKGAWRIAGLPSAMKEFNCLNGACVCKAGYGNGITDENLASYFSCVPCAAGYTNDPPSADNCTMCPPGSYAEQTGQSTCTRCAAGRFSSASGSSTAEVCSRCPEGEYVATTGASACYSCPPGNICPGKGLSIYKECPVGTYQDMPGGTSCMECPAGRWQGQEGSATCTLCDPGRYNAEQGAAEQSMCYPCEEGKYSFQAGSVDCQECGKDTYTDQLRQVKCKPCKVGYTTEGETPSGLGATRCKMKEQPCPAGSYQIIAADSVTCGICANGTYSTDGSNCTDCKAGSYSSEAGSSFCELCPPGKAGTVDRSARSSDCIKCSAGTYMYGEGATTCFDCPPGSQCPDNGMAAPILCASGSHALGKGSKICELCPEGKYQPSAGEAVCKACESGKYGAESNSSQSSGCVTCSAGKFSNTGASACTQCAKGQFQPKAGMTSCLVCTEARNDETLTSNAGNTDCIVNDALGGDSLIEAMYTKGTALYGSFAVAAIFVAIVGAMQLKKEAAHNDGNLDVAQLPRLQVLIKSLLPAFSFASELFLIMGLAVKAPALAAIMITFRALHAIVTSIFVAIIFGSDNVDSDSVLSHFVVGASIYSLPGQINDKFAREAMPLCGGLVLLSMCDCSLLQFLPWKPSPMLTESKGFPSLSMLRWCLSTKVVQGLASTVCQVIFLSSNTSAADKVIMTAQAKALFGMNITMAVVGVVMNLLMLCMKDGLLSRMDTGGGGDGKGPGAGADQERGQAEGRSRGNDGGGGGGDFAHTDIYPSREIGTAVNPMMSMSISSMRGGENNTGEIDQSAENKRLLEKVALLEDENRRLRLENGGDGGSRLSSSISIEKIGQSKNSNLSVESVDQTDVMDDAVAL